MATATTLPTDTKDLERELQQELQKFETVQKKIELAQQRVRMEGWRQRRLGSTGKNLH